jgi:HAD superfamily hydrolase (TIGR01450 family)
MPFTDFDAVLFDIDGTLCAHREALPGAVETINYLQHAGIPVAFVTNNSASTVTSQVARLKKLGICVDAKSIYTSGSAMADWIRSRWERPRVFNFAGDALKEELDGRAHFILPIDAEGCAEGSDLASEKTQAGSGLACDVVAVGTHMRENALAFEYDHALQGLAYLRQGAELLVGSPDRVYMFEDKPEFGSGALGAMFQYGADLPRERIHYAGKPDPEFFLHLCERIGVQANRCLLIGDNLEADIAGGLSVGMTTALLLTGVATEMHVKESSIKPRYVFDGLIELLAEFR